MKSLIMALVFITSSAFGETILSERKVTLPVKLDETNLHLSIAGYSAEVLKVFIPELAAVTFLDHRNPGASAPCMSTYETSDANEVIQGKPGTIDVDFNIQLIKHSLRTSDNKCLSEMQELVTGNIRGFNFSHSRTIVLPERQGEDCL